MLGDRRLGAHVQRGGLLEQLELGKFGQKGANAKGVGNMGWEARPRMTEDHEGTAFMVIAWVGKPT